jgi:peptide/nickel transport system permease protein
MLRYIVRRLLQLIPVLIGISLITFTLSFIVPGDPVRAIMGQRSDREAELRIRQKFGLDKPWYVQYFIWVRNLVRNPGQLPQFKLRVSTDEGTEVYQFRMTDETVLATEDTIREVRNIPWQRNVLTGLYERGCTPPSGRYTSGGTSRTILEIDRSREPTRALLEDFTGEKEWFDVDDHIEVCANGETGGFDLARTGETYNAYFRSEGFQSGRELTAVFDVEEQVVIDGMYDAASSEHTEARNLPTPELMNIESRRRSGGDDYLTLRNENGESREYELMPNAVLLLGGNRATLSQFDTGMEVNVAFTTRSETTLYALYDDASSSLPQIAMVREEHPDSIVATGTVTETVISPAVWFDFGRSYRQQREVRDIIRDSFRNTAYLTLVAMIIAILVGIFAGIVSAVRPYSAVDYFTMTGALIGVSMPVFWLGLMLILLFQGQLGWIKGIGFGEITWHEINLGLFSFHLPWHQNVILPAVTLATVPMAIIARMTRSSMLEVMNLDYIRTARAKGLSEWTVIIRHALKNSLIPIITVIGLNFALLLAGAVLTETVFSWPGLGREIVDAIEFRDFPVVMAGVVLFAFVFVMVNLVVDILYAYVDPRIRYQ